MKMNIRNHRLMHIWSGAVSDRQGAVCRAQIELGIWCSAGVYGIVA